MRGYQCVGASTTKKQKLKFLIELIREHIKAEFAGMGIELPEGMYQQHNGINIFQTRDYVTIGTELYIDRMLLG